MAHRSEIDLAYWDKLLELRDILVLVLGVNRPWMRHSYGPLNPPPPEPTVVDSPDQQDSLSSVNNYLTVTESPESAVEPNISAFESGQDKILLDSSSSDVS